MITHFLTTPAAMVQFPIIMGIICIIIPDIVKGKSQVFAIVGTTLSFLISIFVWIRKPMAWGSTQNTFFVADNLSAFVAVAICFFALIVAVYSSRFIERATGRYFGYLLMALGAALAGVLANNLIILIVAWGFLAAMLYLMVAFNETDGAALAAKKALIIAGSTDAFMIFGIGLAWMISGTFSMDKMRIPLNTLPAYVAYFAIVIAVFAKTGAMPFHSWLPDAAENSPAPVTAYLPASLDKLVGIYLLMRASTDLFIVNNITNLVLMAAGSATLVLAVIFTLVQRDFKRLLGYNAVSQVGYMVIGIGTGTPIGIAGGLFHMLNHAIYESCLFLSGGNVEKRTGTSAMDDLGGLAKPMPVTFICFLVAALSLSGIPPFNGFVSKWMVYQGIIESSKSMGYIWIVWLVAAMFGSALTVAGSMGLMHTIFLGRPSQKTENVREVSPAMTIPIMILAALCIVFGIFAFVLPIPLFISPAVKGVISYLGLWQPTAATIFILIGIITGTLVYLFLKQAKFRSTETFIGGEDPETLGRLSGVDFYNTVKEIGLFNGLYHKEGAASLDVYAVSRNVILRMTGYMRRLHNGILPTYIVWCLLGMAVIFVVLLFR